MTEEDPVFDPSLKKKKKKKKTPFDVDATMGGEDGDAGETGQAAEETNTDGAAADKGFTMDDDLDLALTKKKKKKKKFDFDDMADALPKENSDPAPALADGDAPGMDEDGEGMDFSLPSKKKKKKKVTINIDEEAAKAEQNETGDMSGGQITSGPAWSGSDRDYTYDELLNRVFDIMREKNPDIVAGEKKRFIMKPPQIMRVGTKKSAFANFADICRMLHRQPKHLLAFLLAELGTSGSLDGNNQLIIKGRFQQKQIESVLRSYIKEYVTCHTCRSPETILQKDTRLYFLQCETCGSRCSVQSIKSGFQAVTGKRAALRAKTT